MAVEAGADTARVGVGVVLPTSQGDLMRRGANARLRMSVHAHNAPDLTRSIDGKSQDGLCFSRCRCHRRH